MKLVFTGYGKSGKTTAARILRSGGVRYTSSISEFAKHLLGNRLPGVSTTDIKTDEWRMVWMKTIADYNNEDGSGIKIYKELVKTSDVIEGMRLWRETKLLMDWFRNINEPAWLIWIDRPGIPVDPSCDISPSQCDLVLNNNGDLNDLESKLCLFRWAYEQAARYLKPKPNVEESPWLSPCYRCDRGVSGCHVCEFGAP